MSALADLLACARNACSEARLDPRTMQRIELVLEELFTNTVRHGYGCECESPVWLHAVASPGELRLVYQDGAPAFDPLQHQPDLNPCRSDRQPGGLGLHIARCLADTVAYQRIDDRNVVTLVFTSDGRARESSTKAAL